MAAPSAGRTRIQSSDSRKGGDRGQLQRLKGELKGELKVLVLLMGFGHTTQRLYLCHKLRGIIHN
jgi:hypothetical protein